MYLNCESSLKEINLDKKLFIFDSVILPQKLLGSCENLSENDPLFLILFYSALDKISNFSILDQKKFGTIKDSIEKWIESQNQEFIEPEILNGLINNLKPEESLPVLIKCQNSCIFINRYFKENNLFSTVSAFQVNATNNELITDHAQYYSKYPAMTIRVHNEKMLRSLELSQHICELANIRNEKGMMHSVMNNEVIDETNDVNIPSSVFEWLMPLLSERYPPLSNQLSITKKYKDEVIATDQGHPIRRNPMWISIKGFGHFKFVQFFGEELGTILYKCVILKSVIILTDLFDYSDIEIIFECIKKIGKKIKKLEDKAQDPLISKICEEGKSAILNKRETVEQYYLNHVLRLKFDIFLNPYRTFARLNIGKCDLGGTISKIKLIESEKDIFEKQANPIYEKYSRLNFQSNIPEPGTFRNSFENSIDMCMYEFESWVEKCLDLTIIKFKEYQIFSFFDLLSDYLKTGIRNYRENPVKYSKMVLTCYKLIAVIYKTTCDHYELLQDHNIGLETDTFDSLILPKLEDIQYAHTLISYFEMNNNKEYPSIINLWAESKQSNIFSRRYVERSYECQSLITTLKELQDLKIEKRIEKAKVKINEYNELQEEYDRILCSNIIENNKIVHDQKNCKKCYYGRVMRRMDLKVFEKFLPEDDEEIQIVVFELMIPKPIEILRDAIHLVRTDLLGLTSYGPKIFGLWKDNKYLSSYARSNPILFKFGSTTPNYANQFPVYKQRTKKISYTKDPKNFIVKCGFNLVYCCFDKSIIGYKKNPRELRKNCAFKLGSELSSVQWIMEEPEVTENQIISEMNKCPEALSLGEFRNFGTLRSGKYLTLLRLIDLLEIRGLPFKEESTCYLISQSIWELGCLKFTSFVNTSKIYPETQVLFSNNYYLNQLYKSLNEFFQNNQHNWGEHLLVYTIVVIAKRYINLATLDNYRAKMIELLIEIRKNCLMWIDKIEETIKSLEYSRVDIRKDLKKKLFEITCITILTFDIGDEFSYMVIRTNEDFKDLFNCLYLMKGYSITLQNELTKFENFLFESVERAVLSIENLIHYIVDNTNGQVLKEYIDFRTTTYTNEFKYDYFYIHL